MKSYFRIGKLSVRERLLYRSSRDKSGCWVWAGATSKDGYGHIGVGRKTADAHRVAYEAFVGPIAADLTIDHICCQRACINPTHLQVVSHVENVQLGARRRRANLTHCKRGHEWSAANTYTTKVGTRMCKACMKINGLQHRWRLANQGAST